MPPKKRYSILLPQELAERFERVAKLRHGAKSAMVEDALDRRLNPEKYPLIDEGLLRRLDEQAKSLATLRRDCAIIAELLSLFVRYFLTITPPLGEREQQPARTLGKERFQLFVAQIGRRIASDRRLVSEVLESIRVHNPDLLATAIDDAPLKPPPAGNATVVSPRSNGHASPTPSTEKPDA
jgi:predicted DNA-binding protein